MPWNGYSYGSPSIDDLSIDSDAIPAKKGGALADYDLHKKVDGTSQDTRHLMGSRSPYQSRSAAGAKHEGSEFIPLLKAISIRHEKGRPRKNPERAAIRYERPQRHSRDYCI